MAAQAVALQANTLFDKLQNFFAKQSGALAADAIASCRNATESGLPALAADPRLHDCQQSSSWLRAFPNFSRPC